MNTSDSGINKNYFLYIETWWRTMAPFFYGSNGHASVVYLSAVGHIGDYDVEVSLGGVHFIGLCYNFSSVEAIYQIVI